MPGVDSGYGLRVTNVVRGLSEVGDLHICLIDSSTTGARFGSLPPGVQTSTIRATERPRWQKAVQACLRLPNIDYLDGADLRTKIGAAIGGQPWDLVWCSRVRTHVAARGLVDGPRIVDFDDLNDLLEQTKIRDRRLLNGTLSTVPLNLVSQLMA
ncbi:MAG: hypothetical protein ACRDZ2_08785, partial [Ilumatobacteraceae bacterium]